MNSWITAEPLWSWDSSSPAPRCTHNASSVSCWTENCHSAAVQEHMHIWCKSGVVLQLRGMLLTLWTLAKASGGSGEPLPLGNVTITFWTIGLFSLSRWVWVFRSIWTTPGHVSLLRENIRINKYGGNFAIKARAKVCHSQCHWCPVYQIWQKSARSMVINDNYALAVFWFHESKMWDASVIFAFNWLTLHLLFEFSL